MKRKKIFLFIFWIFFVVFSECIYKMTLFKNIIDTDFVQMIIFSLPVSVLLYFITTLFNENTNKKITLVTVVILYIIFFAQMVYFQIYNNVFSIYSLTNGGQVLEFYRTIFDVIASSLYNYICITIPLIVFLVVRNKYFDYSSNTFRYKSILLGLIFLLLSICLLCLVNDKKAIYGSYNLYFNTHAPILSVKKFGLLTTMEVDLNRTIFGMKTKTYDIQVEKEEKESGVEYNTLDIDFESLLATEEDMNVAILHNYFNSITGTEKNEYTGMFEGKNVVFFLAESFDPIAIDEELTPTLYKLANNGFDFTNYYSPLYPASTADGEFRTEWSLISSRGDTLTLYSAKDTYSPYIFANSFSNYNINIYHNYKGDYYNRNTYFTSLGYNNFKACNYGLDLLCDSFHQSDYDMVNATIDEYINSEEPFFAYYITLSGHLGYLKTTNELVEKNWDLVKDLEYSDKVKGYLACNIELDRALSLLIDKLTETGKLDDTVIILTADHYPYGLSSEDLNEVSDINRDDTFEIYHSDLIIWNSKMTRKEVTKVGSNPDVLPTMLNLFGIDYDSRMIVGQDLLSSKEGLVVLSDRSFITDTVKYNAVTEEAYYTNNNTIDNEEVTVDELYVFNINNLVDNQFKISDLILKTNYYNIVFNKND